MTEFLGSWEFIGKYIPDITYLLKFTSFYTVKGIGCIHFHLSHDVKLPIITYDLDNSTKHIFRNFMSRLSGFSTISLMISGFFGTDFGLY